MSTVLPSYTFGPQLFEEDVIRRINTSSAVINSILTSPPGTDLFNHQGGQIDVRDVARAHIVAFESDQAVGERIVLVNQQFSSQTLIDFLNKHFSKLDIDRGTPGSDKDEIAKLPKINYTKSREILGFDYIPLEQTVIDTANQIIKVYKLQ